MGMRAQVRIKDTGVLLYTHWGSEELPYDIATALGRRVRWNDPEYLTRIIFDSMIPADCQNSEVGFGIGTAEHGDLEYDPIVVCCKDQTVTTDGRVYSFDDFVDLYSTKKITEVA